MELTRLKRELRIVGGAAFEDAQALLDALDRVYEDAEAFEDQLRNEKELTEDDMFQFVIEQAQWLVASLSDLQSVGLRGIFQALRAQFDLARLEDELETLDDEESTSEEYAGKENTG